MNPVLVTLGNIEIRWYSVFILIACVVAIFLSIMEAKKFHIGDDFMFNLAFWSIITGIIGARLYYVAFNFESYKNNLIDILYIWNGGLAIHGGVLAGGICVILYCKKYNKETLKIFDIVSPFLLLAQAIGRWGNFFNQEAHGMATSLQTLKGLHIPEFIINGMNIDGIYYHPTFFYESLWCLIGAIIIIIVRKQKYTKIGQQTCLYFMWYSVGRFFIEAMRTDSLMLGGFKVAQIVSVILFIIALGAFMIISRKGKFEDLYNDNKDTDIKYIN